MSEEIRAELARLLGEAPAEIVPVSGGDIGESYRLRLRDGERYFAKHYAGPEGARMVEAEAFGLAWLAEPTVLRVPRVRAVSGPGATIPLLVLEWIDSGSTGGGTHEELGRGLARLHASGADSFGLDRDNFVGRLPQANAPSGDWASFYRDRRLAPLIDRARAQGLLGGRLLADASRLLERLPQLVGPPEPPARLHGDLWGGNWLSDAEGIPVLIDPAVYGGCREIDLAMMRLFGGFGDRVFEAYREAAPLPDGAEERVDLYQLYPLLVHLNLFGAGYAGAVERALRSYV